jgi:hypothetical protein
VPGSLLLPLFKALMQIFLVLALLLVSPNTCLIVCSEKIAICPDLKRKRAQWMHTWMSGKSMLSLLIGKCFQNVDGNCKGNLTNLRRILHLSLAKGNPK